MKRHFRIKEIVLIFLIGLTLVLAFRFWAVLKLWQTERNYLGLVVYIPKPVHDRKEDGSCYKKALEQWESNPKFRMEFHQFHLILILLIVSTASTAGYSYWLLRSKRRETPDLLESGHERSL